ncbi:MAG: phosphoribosylformylglycinamidine synthase subunit PurS [Syntrophomonadaceae bacterium]|nr:phosphoribosylformylglycinamidine synthase subunit PurS [Syntrophomonadaceae bacterium]
MYKAAIYVTLKEGVLDPQGEAVNKSLQVMGYTGVIEVRIGKFIEVWLQGQDMEEIQAQLHQMADKLLANPVIEEYRIEIVEAEQA